MSFKSKIWYEKQCYHWEPTKRLIENGLQIGMGLIKFIKYCLEMHICLRSWTVSSSQWLSTVNILRNIFPVCGMTDIEQPIIHIRLYREGVQYVESINNKKKNTKKEREKEKEKTHVQ
jgi:hypothetical protein